MIGSVEKLLQSVIEETHIILSALEVQNMELVESALEKRQTVIEELEAISDKKVNSDIEVTLKEYEELDLKCREALKAFNNAMEAEFQDNKTEQRNLQKNKKAHGHYQMQTLDHYSGTSIDHKK